MNNSKGIVPIAIAWFIIAALFLVVAFVAPFDRASTFWIAFAFACLAIVVALGMNLFVIMTSRSMTSALYRASIPAISIGYLLAALIVSLMFMGFTDLPSWLLIIIQVGLLAFGLLGLIGSQAGAALVENGEVATRAQTSAIASLRTQANSVLPFVQDAETRKALSGLCDKLRYTDPVSSPATAIIDQQLMTSMAQLNAAMQTADTYQVQQICANMMLYIDQREAVCRSTK